MVQKILAWCTLLLILLGSFWWQVSEADATSTDTVQVNVYKYLYTNEQSEETKVPICEAAFVGFDLTEEFHQSEMTQQAFIDKYKSLKSEDVQQLIREEKFPLLSSEGGEADEVYTDVDGRASWTVETEKNGLSAVYLFAETVTRDDLSVFETYSQPILLFLPIVDEETGELSTTIDLFPKTISYSCTPYFFKYGKGLDGTEIRLSDAQFVLSRQKKEVKEYWAANQPTNLLLSQWVESSEPKKDSRVKLFISDENGLVSLGNYFLPIGEYLFEEVAAPAGYEIGSDARQIKVVVKGNPEESTIDTILLNNDKLEKNVFGQVSQAIIKKGEPKIYNHEERASESEKKVFPTSPGSKGTLLSTGERLSDMSFLGMSFILLAFLLWRNKRKKNGMNE